MPWSGSVHPFHLTEDACHCVLSPKEAYLVLASYLPASSAYSFPLTAQGAPSIESHKTYMPVSPCSEIGQEAGLETPLSLSGAPVFSATYFFPLALAARQLPYFPNTNPCRQTDRCYLLQVFVQLYLAC